MCVPQVTNISGPLVGTKSQSAAGLWVSWAGRRVLAQFDLPFSFYFLLLFLFCIYFAISKFGPIRLTFFYSNLFVSFTHRLNAQIKVPT